MTPASPNVQRSTSNAQLSGIGLNVGRSAVEVEHCGSPRDPTRLDYLDATRAFALLLGVVLMVVWNIVQPSFFRGESFAPDDASEVSVVGSLPPNEPGEVSTS